MESIRDVWSRRGERVRRSPRRRNLDEAAAETTMGERAAETREGRKNRWRDSVAFDGLSTIDSLLAGRHEERPARKN